MASDGLAATAKQPQETQRSEKSRGGLGDGRKIDLQVSCVQDAAIVVEAPGKPCDAVVIFRIEGAPLDKLGRIAQRLRYFVGEGSLVDGVIDNPEIGYHFPRGRLATGQGEGIGFFRGHEASTGAQGPAVHPDIEFRNANGGAWHRKTGAAGGDEAEVQLGEGIDARGHLLIDVGVRAIGAREAGHLGAGARGGPEAYLGVSEDLTVLRFADRCVERQIGGAAEAAQGCASGVDHLAEEYGCALAG